MKRKIKSRDCISRSDDNYVAIRHYQASSQIGIQDHHCQPHPAFSVVLCFFKGENNRKKKGRIAAE
jgi:hypothetical protein